MKKLYLSFLACVLILGRKFTPTPRRALENFASGPRSLHSTTPHPLFAAPQAINYTHREISRLEVEPPTVPTTTSNESTRPSVLVAQLRPAPQKHPLNVTIPFPASQPLVIATTHAIASLRMEFSPFPIPKSSENTRFTALLSQLPKLTIPLPLQPLETFTLFPRLPIDIRVKIWKLMSTQPRKVKLFFDISSGSRAESRTIEGQSKIPVVLQINRESREEGLRFYTQCRESVEAKLVGHWVNYIYINFEVDHFSHAFPPGSAIGCNFNFGQEVLKKIKFVDANFYGMDEDRFCQFAHFVLARFLMLAESLVDFRFTITSNDYQKFIGSGVLRRQTVGGHLLARFWVKGLLEYMNKLAVWYVRRSQKSPKSFPGGGQQLATKIARNISAVLSEGLTDAAVWYYSLPDLDKLPRQEKQIKV